MEESLGIFFFPDAAVGVQVNAIYIPGSKTKGMEGYRQNINEFFSNNQLKVFTGCGFGIFRYEREY